MAGAYPERDAAQLLEEAWPQGFDGLPLLPVDPVRIAQKLGVDVLVANMKPGVSGAIEKRVGEDPVIYLNRNDSPNRQRFTCAHELGHYYLRTLQGDVAYSWVDRRDPAAASGQDPDEVYANRFGAALIMPKDAVQRLAPGSDVVRLALYLQVSEDAMRFRLKNLGLLHTR
jgi:Zn-dependent peptidase ImmA (M78 family)